MAENFMTVELGNDEYCLAKRDTLGNLKIFLENNNEVYTIENDTKEFVRRLTEDERKLVELVVDDSLF